MALPNFIAEGGDGYTMFPQAMKNAVSKGDLTTILADYISEYGDDITNNIEGRIIVYDEDTKLENSLSSGVKIAIAVVVILAILITIRLLTSKKEIFKEKDRQDE